MPPWMAAGGLIWERSVVARVGLFGVPLLNLWVQGGPWEIPCLPPWCLTVSANLLQLQVDPIPGPEDHLRYQCGRLGRVGAELKAEQGQGQSHLHLVHGKLLPDAVPEERMTNAPIAAFILMAPELGSAHVQAGEPSTAARMMPQLI